MHKLLKNQSKNLKISASKNNNIKNKNKKKIQSNNYKKILNTTNKNYIIHKHKKISKPIKQPKRLIIKITIIIQEKRNLI